MTAELMNELHEPELWLPIANWEEYYAVSNWARVKSFDRRVNAKLGSKKLYPGRILKPKVIDTAGSKGKRSKNSVYYQVTLQIAGRKKEFHNIHRLVCEAFHGPCPAKDWQACHGPKGCHDCRPGNVYWASPSRNAQDRLRDGTQAVGEKHHHARFTEAQVLEIRRRYKEGERQTALAKEFGCRQGTISNLIHRSWAHVS